MPEHRISPAEQMRQALEQLLGGGMASEGEPTSTLVRLAARVVLQEALEAEQRDVVGRDRYERGGVGDTSEVLEQLVTEMYARGLSTLDVEEAFTDATGECILGRSAVSELTDRLWEEYEAFCARDLSGFEVTYLFVDAIYGSLP